MRSIIAASGLAIAAATGNAAIFNWTWTPGLTAANNAGGAFETIFARYDTVAQKLDWTMTFSNQISQGFTLVLGDGPLPRGDAGEYGILYFDATQLNNVRVNVFAYNGVNAQNSFTDGSAASGTQTPDRIATNTGNLASNFITASASDNGGKRTFTFSMNAAGINAHSPLYPASNPADEWFGIGFAAKLGLWLHPNANLSTTYNSDGYLTRWNGTQGWIDAGNLGTNEEPPVPAPAGAAALALVGLTAVARRRAR